MSSAKSANFSRPVYILNRIAPFRINVAFACGALILVSLACASMAYAQETEDQGISDGLLMPDYDAFRRERLEVDGERLRTPEGFIVEEVASDELIGSCINMTFDWLGRPIVSSEKNGIRILLDEDDDGLYESQKSFCEEVSTAMGMHFIGPGDLLVQANGPNGPGLYRLTDTDGDDEVDIVQSLGKSNGNIGEHGPHTILTGPDGFIYLLYGNHAHPAFAKDPLSPSRDLQEDHLLPRILDPRGHANKIRAPGGTIQRFNPETGEVSQIVGGFRNPFDMAMNASGDIFNFEADMEWDFGLPWYREIRVVHAVEGGDFGWRTGSSKMPLYYIDTLPSVDDVGRGSPVGVAFYYHDAYPEQFHGALFMGDWARGRIRVIMPERDGATYTGTTQDFVLGEPLNVTDLDIGPDGSLYYTTGGRSTTGGLYRVRYDEPIMPRGDSKSITAILDQPMPRSAWGKEAIKAAKEKLGGAWGRNMRNAALNHRLSSEQRVRALEFLQVHGPRPDLNFLTKLLSEEDAEIRSAAVFLIGTYPLVDSLVPLQSMLNDDAPFVVRRACEALVRAGLNKRSLTTEFDALAIDLLILLDHEDRFTRYAARNALRRIPTHIWADAIFDNDFGTNPHKTLEGLLSLIYEQDSPEIADAIYEGLAKLNLTTMDDQTLLEYLRVLSLALIRDERVEKDSFREELVLSWGPRLLERFPSSDWRLNRELQVMLAAIQAPGAIDAMLSELTFEKSQEDQIHTAYALRTIQSGWTEDQQANFVDWFDQGREIRGAASMEGFVDSIWKATLELLPEDERIAAEEHKKYMLDERNAAARELVVEFDGEASEVQSDLEQMSFEELADYLEFDPMAYRTPKLDVGRRVFTTARCIDCHVFGSIGRGGGPDLSTVTSRFRRRDILESIMYPNKTISDQYAAVDVETKDGSVTTGMVVDENEDTLIVITSRGDRVELNKDDISERYDSEISIMPDGLLHTMRLTDLVQLIQFLERGADF